MPMCVAQVHGLTSMLLCVGVVALSCLLHVSAYAIDVHPTAEQIQAALEQGKEAAQKRSPPDTFYVGSAQPTSSIPAGF